MKGRFLRFLSAAAMIPVIASSVFFAKNVMAAEQTYNGTIKDYTYDEKYNTGKYIEPVKDGKYQAMIHLLRSFFSLSGRLPRSQPLRGSDAP